MSKTNVEEECFLAYKKESWDIFNADIYWHLDAFVCGLELEQNGFLNITFVNFLFIHGSCDTYLSPA